MAEWLRILLAVLACYRLAQLIAVDDGPWDIFVRLRSIRIGVLHRLFGCPYCLGVWFAALMGLLLCWQNSVGDMVLLILGIAGGQTLLQTLTDWMMGWHRTNASES